MAKTATFGARSTADQVLAGIDLTGKHILVTGCGSGIGFETMNALAANGAHVLGMDRTWELAAQACKEVAYDSEPLACDLSDFDSIAASVASLRERGTPIDVVIANAAVAYLPALNTRYGVEMQFLTNHLGHFALVTQMLELLRDGSGRVVVVSGAIAPAAEEGTRGIMFDNLAGQRFYRPDAFYAQSKLANALFAKELSRRVRARGISVNSVDPGVVRGTRIHQHLTVLQRLGRNLAAPFFKSRAQGAATSVLLAGSPNVAGQSGELWRDCAVVECRLLADDDLAAELWAVSEALVTSPRVVEEQLTERRRAERAAA